MRGWRNPDGDEWEEEPHEKRLLGDLTPKMLLHSEHGAMVLLEQSILIVICVYMDVMPSNGAVIQSATGMRLLLAHIVYYRIN